MPARETAEDLTCVRAGLVDGTWRGSLAGVMDVPGLTSWECMLMSVT